MNDFNSKNLPDTLSTQEETKITKYFRSNGKKFRICYVPTNKKKILNVQINYHINFFIPVVKRLVNCKKYQIIHFYTNMEGNKEIKETRKELERIILECKINRKIIYEGKQISKLTYILSIY
ncbi:hypothetical protein NUSPORA_01702 [Nucleospora cyclopteri]